MRQRQADGRPTKQYEQGDHADRSNAHHSLIGSFLRVWHLVSAVAAVAELASGHTLSYSPLRELAADGIRDRALPPEKLEQMPLFLAEMYRGISRCRLRLYPHVREVLDVLREHYPLAVVTDAQSSYARGELHKVGLLDYFDPIVVSGDHGYRKPDRRLFQFALDGMGVAAENALYVGNDMHRDIFGAQEAGMTTVKFESGQGADIHLDCVPDYTITDFRDLLKILDLP